MSHPRSPYRPWWITLGFALCALFGLAPAARAQAVNNPPLAPLQILTFTQRDFVSASGYEATDRVIVKVIHPDGTVRSTDPSQPIIPQGDPLAGPGAPFAGLVEVNHPGAACWFGVTPDIRAGDLVQIDIVGGPRAGRSDAMTVQDLYIGRPVQTGPEQITVKGFARDPLGLPIDVNAIGVRFIALGGAFDANGGRALRGLAPRPGVLPPPGQGVVTSDVPGGAEWTAVFDGLSPADVARALSAIARVDWIPGGGVEGTAYEVGAGIGAGPAASCVAPLEKLPPPPGSELVPPSIPTDLVATVSNFSNVTLTWTPSTDNVGVIAYGIYRDGVAIGSVQNPDESAPAPSSYIDRNVPPGTYLYTIDAADSVGNRSAESVAITVTTQARPAPAVAAHEPPVLPVALVLFPSRDFVSSSGWLPTDQVNVEVLRDGRVISTASGIVPDPGAGDPFGLGAFEGIVEVNHPGAACWQGLTPEMRAGDIVRFTAYDANGNVRTIEQTRVAGVTAQRAIRVQDDDPATLVHEGVVEIHGTAMDADGQPLPPGQLEARMITTSSLFAFNGRRSLRASAGSDGILSYDATDNPLGIKWTATFLNLEGDDVARLVGGVSSTSGFGFSAAETRIHWIGQIPELLNEITIFENSDGNPPGPATPGCTAVLESPDVNAPSAPRNLVGGSAGPHAFQLSWAPSTDDWSVGHYRVLRDGQPYANVAATQNTFLDRAVPAGAHTYAIVALDHASPLAAGADAVQRIFNGLGREYGNVSVSSNLVSMSQADLTAPSVPQGFVAVAGPNLVGLEWEAATDDVAVASYRIYRNGAAVADIAAPAVTHIDSLLATGLYTYQIDAADAAGNRSARSGAVTIQVQAREDIQAPSTPTGLAAVNSPDLHGRDVTLTWNASADPNLGGGVNGLVTGYGIYRNGLRIATVAAPALTYTDRNVAVGTHRYQVDAFDSPFNHSNTSASVTVVVANSPPPVGHQIIPFPSRDFISASGYSPAGNPYRFEVVRAGTVFVSDTISVRSDDPSGTIEVNHPGGTCWLVTTPDLVPGDVVRVVSAQGIADQTYVGNVAAGRPIATGANSFEVHGIAMTATGAPMPIGQVEHRIITAGELFDLNGSRSLRAGPGGGEGVLSYDAPGSVNWTARYSGIPSGDMFRVMGGTDPAGGTHVPAESRGVWFGRIPNALLELTIQETGPGVPGGPIGDLCIAPLQIPVPAASLAPGLLAFGTAQATTAAQSAVLRNIGGSPLVIRNVYVSGLHPGDFTITAGAGARVLAPGATLTMSVTFSPKSLGLRQAFLSIDANAANTTDFSIPLTGTGLSAQAPPAPGTPVAGFVSGTQMKPVAGGGIANSLMPVRISWAPSVSPLLTHYQLQVSVNSAAWVDVAPQPGLATSVSLELPVGTTAAPRSYQYRVRAMNLNAPSPWTIGQRFGHTVQDNQSTGISYSGAWTLAGDPLAYGGSVRFQSAARTATTLLGRTRFTLAGSIAWITTMGPDRGIVSIVLDRGAPVLVDLYSPTVRKAAVAYAANVSAGATHTITVNVTGTRNAASTGTRVDNDAFVVLDASAGSTPAELQQADDTEFDSTPKALAFAPISPNPSHGEAMLSFALPREGRIEMGIVDVTGRQVRSLHSGAMNAGSHHLVWDGRTSAGQSSAPGIYFAVMRFEDRVLTQRIVRIP